MRGEKNATQQADRSKCFSAHSKAMQQLKNMDENEVYIHAKLR